MIKVRKEKIHMDVMEYSPKTSLVIIDHIFVDKNRDLVDSIKFVCSQIKIDMELSLEYFYFFKLLNDLLKIVSKIRL
ncbi:hypothetical protein BpHYR1_007505 [Brachionus plicatilis]|uniref:Uncharacterized protein n=1 Tax=Brachionus plicatilis TaxID=10195 RepID=A0A3M7QVQ9_BRAPC|nr:hypothetical protein BpHYR1_007505 [Brachionus plicatilis]